MTLRFITILCSLCFLSACATQPAKYITIDSINSSVEFLSPDRSTLPASHFTNKVVLFFPYISGGIFGNPDSPPLFYNFLSNKLTFSIDLASARNTLEKASSTLSPQWFRSGLRISPVNTRLSRIGTFAHNAETGKPIGAGGFIDTESKDNLILVYVDRPCRIAGKLRLDKDIFLHSINLPSKGFHWLRVHTTGRNQFEIKHHPYTTNIKFSIHLLHMTNV